MYDAANGRAQNLAHPNFFGALLGGESSQPKQAQAGNQDGQTGKHHHHRGRTLLAAVQGIQVIIQKNIVKGRRGQALIEQGLDLFHALWQILGLQLNQSIGAPFGIGVVEGVAANGLVEIVEMEVVHHPYNFSIVKQVRCFFANRFLRSVAQKVGYKFIDHYLNCSVFWILFCGWNGLSSQ